MNDASSQDQNQRLAERIGQLRAEGASLNDLRATEDELAAMLLDYREQVGAGDVEAAPETTRRLWSRIEAGMKSAESASVRQKRAARRPDRAPKRSSSRRVLWRTAVALVGVLVLVVVTWWAWPAPDATLVAEATTQVTAYETPVGDVVRLRPNSRLYRTSETDARFRLEGEAFFNVTHRAEAPFTVEADGAVVRVLGTRFTVQTWTPRPLVFLEEGRVALQSVATGDTVALRSGEAGTIAEDGRVAVSDASAESYVDWLEGRVAFDSQPASAVAAELEQHYDIQIHLPDSIAAETLTGRLLLDDRNRTLSDFGRVLGGRFEQVEGAFRFRAD
jgi:transmembrane sensor